jgi:hypothetical protein
MSSQITKRFCFWFVFDPIVHPHSRFWSGVPLKVLKKNNWILKNGIYLGTFVKFGGCVEKVLKKNNWILKNGIYLGTFVKFGGEWNLTYTENAWKQGCAFLQNVAELCKSLNIFGLCKYILVHWHNAEWKSTSLQYSICKSALSLNISANLTPKTIIF